MCPLPVFSFDSAYAILYWPHWRSRSSSTKIASDSCLYFESFLSDHFFCQASWENVLDSSMDKICYSHSSPSCSEADRATKGTCQPWFEIVLIVVIVVAVMDKTIARVQLRQPQSSIRYRYGYTNSQSTTISNNKKESKDRLTSKVKHAPMKVCYRDLALPCEAISLHLLSQQSICKQKVTDRLTTKTRIKIKTCCYRNVARPAWPLLVATVWRIEEFLSRNAEKWPTYQNQMRLYCQPTQI